MSESQLVAFFRDKQGTSQNLCGRFRQDQLQKNYNIDEWFPAWSVQDQQVQYEIPVAIMLAQTTRQQIKLPLIRHMKVVRNMAAAMLTLLCIEEGIGQNRVISGQVIEAEGKSVLAGVSILVKGTTRGTVSDSSGYYKIEVSDNDILVFNSIGFKEVKERIAGTKESIKTAMETEVTNLPEVVVTGYSCSRIKMGTGAISTGAISIVSGFDAPLPPKKFATKVAIWGNAVQNGELILVPELAASVDYTGNSFERANDEKWFRENGFQEVTSVHIYDNSGRIYSQSFIKTGNDMLKVDVSDIPEGAYVVRVIFRHERSLTEQEVATTRVLIER